MTQSFVMSFIPKSLHDDVDTLRRAELLVKLSFTFGVLAILALMQNILLFQASFFADLGMVIGAVLSVANAFILKKTRSLRLTANLLIGVYLTVITVLYYSFGGLQSSAIYFFVVAPVTAFALQGRKYGQYIGAVTLALIVLLCLAQITELVAFPPGLKDEAQRQMSVIAAILTLTVFIMTVSTQSERSREITLALLHETQRAAEQRAREDYEKLSQMKAESERRAAEDVARIEAQKEYLAHSVEMLLGYIRQVAEGDLTVRIPEQSNDDIGKLAHALNQTLENVEAMVIRVADSADKTVDAVRQISRAAEDLRASSQKQLAQAEHVAGAVEEMSSTIGETTQQTSVAAHEASLANDDAQRGHKAMQSMLDNVQSISRVVVQGAEKISALGRSSTQIGEIIQVIDEIADQTNLLALNAAIEAARAGDAGRGFAVVADEVRKLAERTQKATKEIANTIKVIQHETGDAVGAMQAGTRLVEEGQKSLEQTSAAFSAILERTERVSGVMSQLAVASEEQSRTSNVMAENVGVIAQVIEEAVQNVQHIASSATGLQMQSQELQHLIGQFRINRADARDGYNLRPKHLSSSQTRLLA
ncbi:MAG: methyl-accepting chemotaxis protein [Bacteroidota bacterium]|nr:methyl-accepting chemotaxis protein [Candidatus Kapabacteria bacterium]MDW8219630.1 methyl-accepting chemotaxis protein [Bacteroidota bacterium]